MVFLNVAISCTMYDFRCPPERAFSTGRYDVLVQLLALSQPFFSAVRITLVL